MISTEKHYAGDHQSKHVIEIVHFADPWCWWSWGLEPVLQRLKEVYGDQVEIAYRMGGITDDVSEWRREYEVVEDEALKGWISESNSITGLPVDPECYLKANARTTWPACIAVKAVQLQDEELGERFYRRLMETILVRSENGSDEDVYLRVAKETGVNVDRMKKDIASGRAKDFYLEDKKAMNVSFLTLRYVNQLTGSSKDVENKFAASEHMNTIEELTGEKLSKKTPIDILDYFERHRGDLIGPKEIAEVFSTSVEDAERRIDLLAKYRLLSRKEFGFEGSYWALEGTIKTDLTLEQVKISHVTGPSQVSSEADLTHVITNAVKNLYTQVAKEPHKTYHFPLGREALLLVGYPSEEIDKLPESAIESFAGVGYPHATNSIRPGDTVLDIGSGSGTDVLIASLRTGPQGKVMGLDITDAMMEKARTNIDKMGAKNVKIIKGDAREIPLDDGSVDVATSNGVLNLVPDKRKAFREVYRVLKPGGRLQLSDIVVQNDVQKVCGLVPQLWADCIGGAAVESEYLATIKDAGFKDAKVIKRLDYFAASSSENTKRLTKTFGAESVVIAARKPG